LRLNNKLFEKDLEVADFDRCHDATSDDECMTQLGVAFDPRKQQQ
jgi:hypothetical protein